MSKHLLRATLVAATAAMILPATAFADNDGKNTDCHVERGP